MNPHANYSTSPLYLLRRLRQHWQLIVQMTKRDVVGRYKGSVMGLMWSFLNPLFMLVVYTFVFSVVFKARWSGAGEETRSEFAVVLFTGMIVHSLFAEILNKAPTIILNNTSYVKRVVFPLEILPIITAGGALFHALVSLLVLIGAIFFAGGVLHFTILLIPVVILPLLTLTIGLAWFFSSLGVYLRDVGQTVGILTTIMLFLSPVFFPVSALPEYMQPYMIFNPLTFIIEQSRAVLILGRLPDWQGLGIYMIIATLVAWLGFTWFQKTRGGFADVL
jgi:lipopolysaccharide transport system permease protein